MLFGTSWERCIAVAILVAGGCTLSTEGTKPEGVASGGAAGTGGQPVGSTSTTGGAGGAGGVGGQGGAGGSVPENCINGVDDDGDGLVDCDDVMDCGQYLCTDAPAGDYVVLGDSMGMCPAGYTPDAVYDCQKCGCGTACTFQVELYTTGQDCNDPSDSKFTFDPSVSLCQDIPDLTAQNGGFGFKAVVTLGTDQCVATSGGTAVTICRPEGVGTCASGTKACVPMPASGELGCMVTSANCANPFKDETVVYEGLDDSTCGCSCSGASNCSQSTITQYKDTDNCSGHSHDGVSDGSCGTSNDNTFKSFGVTAAVNTCMGGSAPAGMSKKLCCGLTVP